MKKSTKILFFTMIAVQSLLISCGNSEKKEEAPKEVATEHYQCPMKCTEEVFDKPGQCSVCGMELEKITKS